MRTVSTTEHFSYLITQDIPHKQEIDKLLRNFSTNILHTYNLPIDRVHLAEEYQHLPRLKDIYQYIT